MMNPTISWYDENAEGLSEEYDKAEVDSLHALLRRWVPSPGKVLEIGCGSGRDAFFLASIGCSVVAIDGSDAMLRTAQKKLTVKRKENIIFQSALFPLPDGHSLFLNKFDAVTAIAVLMHFSDKELFISACQIRTLLKENGIFLCSFSSGKRACIDGRLYENRKPEKIQQLFEDRGFQLLAREESKDGLGRNISWTTLVFSCKHSGNLSSEYDGEIK